MQSCASTFLATRRDYRGVLKHMDSTDFLKLDGVECLYSPRKKSLHCFQGQDLKLEGKKARVGSPLNPPVQINGLNSGGISGFFD